MVITHKLLFFASITFCLFNGPISAKVIEKQELSLDKSFNKIADTVLYTKSADRTYISNQSSEVDSDQSFIDTLATNKNLQLFLLLVVLSIVSAGLGIYMRDHDL